MGKIRQPGVLCRVQVLCSLCLTGNWSVSPGDHHHLVINIIVANSYGLDTYVPKLFSAIFLRYKYYNYTHFSDEEVETQRGGNWTCIHCEGGHGKAETEDSFTTSYELRSCLLSISGVGM